MPKSALELKQELQEVRNQKQAQYDTAIAAAAGSSERSVAMDKFNELQKRSTELENMVTMAESQEAEARSAAASAAEANRAAANAAPSDSPDRRKNPRESEEARAHKDFRLLKTLRSLAENRPLEGLSKELDQEGRKEARSANVDASGSFVLPSFIIQNDPERRARFEAERRAQSATGGSSGSEGGTTVQTNVGPLINILEANLFLERIGATMFRGQIGNLDLPRNNSDVSGTWEGEVDDAAETSAGFDKLSLTPKRLAAYMKWSKQLLLQGSIDGENFARRRLNFAVNKKLTSAAIAGDPATVTESPRGILYTTGIGNVAMGTNGGVPTWAKVVALETAVATEDADLGKLAYLTTPGVRGVMKVTEKASSTGMFIWNDVRYQQTRVGELNGYDAHASTITPSTLTKGSSSGNCHAIIFGNWEDLVVAQWGGLDITVDPYTLATNAQVKITVNSFWDIGVMRVKSFAAIKDATLS